jgi:hypothetical protein
MPRTGMFYAWSSDLVVITGARNVNHYTWRLCCFVQWREFEAWADWNEI